MVSIGRRFLLTAEEHRRIGTAVLDRELRALEAAGERFPDAGKRLLAFDRDDLPASLPDGVVAETAWEWMLPARNTTTTAS